MRTLTPPTKTRKFKVAGGIRKFKAVSVHSKTREVIVVAKTAKKAPNKKKNETVEDDDLEELESLEDLDDLEDEDDEDEVEEDEDEDEDEDDEEPEDEDEEEDDEDEDDEEDEEEEPAPKKRAKKTASKSKKSDGKVGTQEVADHFGTDARTLRMVLRKHSIEKDDETGRYEWSSLNHPVVKKIGKLLKGGAAKEAKKEGLDKLKKTKSDAKKTSSTKKTGTKKRTKKA